MERVIYPLYCGLLLLFLVIDAHAQTEMLRWPGVESRAAEAALSNRTLQLRYLTNGSVINMPDAQLAGGLFLSEDRDVIGTVALQVPADISLGRLGRRLSFTFGPRAYVALLSNENEDVFAIALGAQVRYVLAFKQDLAIVGSAFYAPDILTFGSGDNVSDLFAGAEMKVARGASVFAGWRWFKIKLPGPDRTLQDDFIAGVRLQF